MALGIVATLTHILGSAVPVAGLVARDDPNLEELVKRQFLPIGLGGLPVADLLKTATGAAGSLPLGGNPLAAVQGLTKGLPLPLPGGLPNIGGDSLAAVQGLTKGLPLPLPGVLPNIGGDPLAALSGLTSKLPVPVAGNPLAGLADLANKLPLPAGNPLTALSGLTGGLPLGGMGTSALPNVGGDPLAAVQGLTSKLPLPGVGGVLPGGVDTGVLAGLLSSLLKNLPNAQTLSDPTKAVSGIVDTVSSLAPAVLNTIQSITPTLSALGPLAAATQLLPLADPTKFAALQGLTGLDAIKNAVGDLSPDQLSLLKSLPLPTGAGANPLAVVNAVFAGVSAAIGSGINVDLAFSALFLRSVGIPL